MVRNSGLDFLRGFALVLGIVFHSGIVYASGIGYVLQSQDRSYFLEIFCYFVHSFRMPLFFFLAGFFSEIVLIKKGLPYFLKQRTHRIFIPSLFGILFLAPWEYLFLQNKGDFLHSYLSFFNKENFLLSHIWFLIYLSLFTLLYALYKVISNRQVSFYPLDRFQWTSVICLSSLLTVIANWYFPKGMKFWGLDGTIFFYQGSFFVGGLLFSKTKPEILFSSKDSRLLTLIITVLSFIAFYFLEKKDPLWQPFYWVPFEIRFFHLVLWSLTAWAWIRLFLQWSQKIQELGDINKYLLDASLFLYLIHHPISLAWALHFRDSPLPIFVRFVLHLAVVLGVSLLSFSVYKWILSRSKLA